jgi:hypothetical protein
VIILDGNIMHGSNSNITPALVSQMRIINTIAA